MEDAYDPDFGVEALGLETNDDMDDVRPGSYYTTLLLDLICKQWDNVSFKCGN